MSDYERKDDLAPLFLKLIENNISDQELELLEQILSENPEYVREYCQFAATYSAVQVKFGADITQPDRLDWKLISELAEYEVSAPEVVIEKPVIENNIHEKASVDFYSKHRRLRFWYYSIFTTAASILIFFVIYANVFPPQLSEPVATLVDQINVKWHQESERLLTNDRLLTHQAPYFIDNGILSIRYDNGVDVVIEGPAKFEIDRDGIFLNHGKLYSHVSPTGTGFAVDTPNSRFIDLGTEFGVEVDVKGSSELHVMDGEVQLYAGRTGGKRSSKKVFQGNAYKFDAEHGNLETIPMKDNQFVRFVNSKSNDIWRGEKLSLADLVAGGNGFGTGKPNICIHPLTGKFTFFKDASTSERLISVDLKPVLESEFVDSIFVPDGNENEPVVISSNGVTYSGFPDTRGKFFSYLKANPYYLGEGGDGYYDKYDPSSENVAIYMHSNLGVTFDLAKIRNNFGNNIKIPSFNFEYGFRNESNKKNGKIDFWVFVDGELKFSARQVEHFIMPKAAQLSLADDASFLTLSITESDDGGGRDWGAFINPELTIEK